MTPVAPERAPAIRSEALSTLQYASRELLRLPDSSAASPASASLVLLKSRPLTANKDNKMNSLAFSLASQIGFSRRHFFVVNGLAFLLSNLERKVILKLRT
jgi:hypothetical protein